MRFHKISFCELCLQQCQVLFNFFDLLLLFILIFAAFYILLVILVLPFYLALLQLFLYEKSSCPMSTISETKYETYNKPVNLLQRSAIWEATLMIYFDY